MALILALNPAGAHNATLARVARELKEHELIGADTAAIAVKAIEKRVPALVLLPAAAAPGEGDLLRRLSRIPQAVATVRLPPVLSADPVIIAEEIRELLGGKPAGPSRHLLAAAKAAVNWIRGRRTRWAASRIREP